jgi:hypothetical protein
MPLKIHEIYKSFAAPDNLKQCLLGEVLDVIYLDKRKPRSGNSSSLRWLSRLVKR